MMWDTQRGDRQRDNATWTMSDPPIITFFHKGEAGKLLAATPLQAAETAIRKSSIPEVPHSVGPCKASNDHDDSDPCWCRAVPYEQPTLQ